MLVLPAEGGWFSVSPNLQVHTFLANNFPFVMGQTLPYDEWRLYSSSAGNIHISQGRLNLHFYQKIS